jgi:DNA replication protein DnaC
MRRRLAFANIPEAFKGYRLSNFTLTAYLSETSKKEVMGIVQCVKAYLDSLELQIQSGKGFYFYSDTKGSGKTRLMASISNELIEKYNKQVKFCTSTKILEEIKATYDKNTDRSESKLLDDLVNTEILVIDDFGTEKTTDFVKEKFYFIVNERYIAKKVTFYTSNYSLEELQHDDRVTNRIKECSYQLHFPEESIRDHIAKKNVENLLGIKG